MRSPVILSCYTEDYTELADRLKQSADRFGYSHIIEQIPEQGSWIANTLYKPVYILDKIVQNSMIGFFIWIDADGVINLPIDVEPYRTSDVSMVWLRRELLTGTIFLNNTIATRKLLTMWKERCYTQTGRIQPDANVLQDIIDGGLWGGQLGHLLPQYCRIFDNKVQDSQNVPRYIEHFQASRKFRKKKMGRP
ncbi:MAG: hypothetical protein DRZ76_03965 [Candidatus Nealsonbacteria bacterium]|nr:MAG: hypothetical protein DRZ76_03965 [Candidatus Nealsonbacteria bacterium]